MRDNLAEVGSGPVTNSQAKSLLPNSGNPLEQSVDAGQSTIAAHRQTEVWSFVTLCDGKSALSGGGKDGKARIWNIDTGRLIRELTASEGRPLGDGEFAYNPVAVAASADGTRIVTGSDELRVWELASGRRIQAITPGSAVTSLRMLPDENRIISGHNDGSVSLWDITTGQRLRQLNGHTSYVRAVDVLPSGRHAVSASYDDTVRLWDMDDGTELRRFVGHDGDALCVATLPDGKRILSGSGDNTIRLWDLENGSEELRFLGHSSYVLALAMLPDGRRVLSGSSDKTIRLWDLATGAELRRNRGTYGPRPSNCATW